MSTAQGSREHQAACVETLLEVLRRNGYADVRFEYQSDGLPRYVARFEFQGREHQLEVYDSGPVMTSGAQLFESYMPGEYESEEALREGFAARLNRYLSGGEWAGPDEPGLWESVKRSLAKSFGR